MWFQQDSYASLLIGHLGLCMPKNHIECPYPYGACSSISIEYKYFQAVANR